MASISDLTALKSKADAAQREADRASGALEQTLARLKSEFECDSLADAEALLKKLKSKEAKAQQEWEDAYNEFVSKWNKSLE